MKKFLLAVAVGVCTSFGAAGTGYSQPAEGGMAQNPNGADAQDAALKQAMDQGMKQAKAMMAMTPAQRREWMDKMMEQQLRALLAMNGVADKDLQDRIILFTQEQKAEQLKLRQSTARLRDALASKATTPEQITALLAEAATAATAERERKSKAEGALAEELELAKNPRLEGVLRLYGIMGDSAGLLGGVVSGLTALSTLPDAAELPAR